MDDTEAQEDHFPAFGADTRVVAAAVQVSARELSGTQWVQRFPTSVSLQDLATPFRDNVIAFIAAIESAGGIVAISATLRPPERAYLMHYCSRLASGDVTASRIPALPGVAIQWNHGKEAASRAAARSMRDAYQIVFPPALRSNHTLGLAIDMRISGVIGRSIARRDGTIVRIASLADLHPVGATYGVVKLPSDPPHWSHDGH